MAAVRDKSLICNCLAVRQVARQVTQLYDDELAGTGLRATQYTMMANLALIAPATVQELADHLVMDRTTVAHALRPLETDGLVAIGVDGTDRRVRRLSLTSKGTRELSRARPGWQRAQDRFESALGGAAEAARFRKQLARAVEAASTTAR